MSEDHFDEIEYATEQAYAVLYSATLHFMHLDVYSPPISGTNKLLGLQGALLLTAAKIALVLKDSCGAQMTKVRFGRLARAYYARELPQAPHLKKKSRSKSKQKPDLKIVKDEQTK